MNFRKRKRNYLWIKGPSKKEWKLRNVKNEPKSGLRGIKKIGKEYINLSWWIGSIMRKKSRSMNLNFSLAALYFPPFSPPNSVFFLYFSNSFPPETIFLRWYLFTSVSFFSFFLFEVSNLDTNFYSMFVFSF